MTGKSTSVSIKEISEHPTMRMDAAYWIASECRKENLNHNPRKFVHKTWKEHKAWISEFADAKIVYPSETKRSKKKMKMNESHLKI